MPFPHKSRWTDSRIRSGPNSEENTSAFGRSDRDDQPDHPRMGKLLLSLSCQKALPSAGWLDHPKALVAPRQAVAERSLEGISDRTAARRVQAGRAGLTDPFASGRKSPFMKAGCGKTARPVCAADGGQRKSNRARLLRPDTAAADGRQHEGWHHGLLLRRRALESAADPSGHRLHRSEHRRDME